METSLDVSTCPTPRSLTFLSLPGEVRNDIYDLALTTSGQKTFRSSSELHYQKDLSGKEQVVPVTLTDVGLLTVSKQVGREAASIFYGQHIFHYSIKRRGTREPPAHFFKQITAIKHLSISYTATYPRSIKAQRIDKIVAQHIQFITENCTQLSTLNFHILANQMEGNGFESPLEAGQTSEKLCSLYPRLERLTLISFGPFNALAKFRNSISTPIARPNRTLSGPSSKPARSGSVSASAGSVTHVGNAEMPASHFWSSYVGKQWPHITISPWEASAMVKRQSPHQYHHWNQEESIRVWQLEKLGSHV